jgi:hypothetical protein
MPAASCPVMPGSSSATAITATPTSPVRCMPGAGRTCCAT